jgi:hypothetical protein
MDVLYIVYTLMKLGMFEMAIRELLGLWTSVRFVNYI